MAAACGVAAGADSCCKPHKKAVKKAKKAQSKAAAEGYLMNLYGAAECGVSYL